MEYFECPVIAKLVRKTEPIVTSVEIDVFTDMAQANFDYEFDGNSLVYPFELPTLPDDFKTMCIVGASGSGKSTLLREFDERYSQPSAEWHKSKAIVSHFKNPKDASNRLSAVGLNSIPVWCRPRHVLSVGEGFRADLARNLDNYTIFDEFTSTIDRNVAKSTCNGIQRYIKDNGLHNIVFCSCHKDYISFLCPDFVVDTDTMCVYDCRGADLKKASSSQCTKQQTKTRGDFFINITI